MMTPPTPKTAKTSRITGGRVRDIINAARVKAVRADVVLAREAK